MDTNTVLTESKAYLDGYNDGLDWDLSGFDSIGAARAAGGWDEATINAVGVTKCAAQWGVPEEGEEWSRACADYSRGVKAALAVRA